MRLGHGTRQRLLLRSNLGGQRLKCELESQGGRLALHQVHVALELPESWRGGTHTVGPRGSEQRVRGHRDAIYPQLGSAGSGSNEHEEATPVRGRLPSTVSAVARTSTIPPYSGHAEPGPRRQPSPPCPHGRCGGSARRAPNRSSPGVASGRSGRRPRSASRGLRPPVGGRAGPGCALVRRVGTAGGGRGRSPSLRQRLLAGAPITRAPCPRRRRAASAARTRFRSAESASGAAPAPCAAECPPSTSGSTKTETGPGARDSAAASTAAPGSACDGS